MDIKIERKKILIVDDDQDFLRALALHLKGKGYETVAATDGVTAISVALEQKPDLILLDIGLPAGDGFTVLSRLASLEATMLKPVIIVSCMDPVDLRQRALNAGIGVAAFFHKPLNLKNLDAAIQDSLQSPSLEI
jgi:putative two-component system response regulator